VQILIFEGIATSGKSTIINRLAKSLPKEIETRVLTEDFTHIPIMKKNDDLCIDFFKRLISEILSSGYEVVLIDRLYLTQAFRAGASLEDYLEIEMMLFTQYVTTIFLTVDESEIAKRLVEAIKHREPSWGEYVSTKGDSREPQAAYYMNQQRHQLGLLMNSKLPYEIYDTTNHDYKTIVDSLKKEILSNN
jgi:archaellum biogenesis ATPase FlaH